jgi:hypothetical protein
MKLLVALRDATQQYLYVWWRWGDYEDAWRTARYVWSCKGDYTLPDEETM